MIRQTRALLSQYSNVIGRVENKGTWTGGMTSLFPYSFIIFTSVLIFTPSYLIFQRDPDTEKQYLTVKGTSASAGGEHDFEKLCRISFISV